MPRNRVRERSEQGLDYCYVFNLPCEIATTYEFGYSRQH